MGKLIDPQALQSFTEALALREMPFAVFSSETIPEEALTPKNSRCVIGVLRLARKRRLPVVMMNHENLCPGGRVYMNLEGAVSDFIPAFVSTGMEGVFEGEHYCKNPEIVSRYLDQVTLKADALPYRIFKPIDMLDENEIPEVVVFFETPDVLSGLFTLVQFEIGDSESIIAPFGAGCACIYTWVKRYLEDGKERAVIGGFDPSARPFMAPDELTFSFSYSLFKRLMDSYRESFLFTHSWQTIKKRINKQSI
jgi:uncharacterized protein (DUF169 family)